MLINIFIHPYYLMIWRKKSHSSVIHCMINGLKVSNWFVNSFENEPFSILTFWRCQWDTNDPAHTQIIKCGLVRMIWKVQWVHILKREYHSRLVLFFKIVDCIHSILVVWLMHGLFCVIRRIHVRRRRNTKIK